jgi:thymidylate synthase (FAD)
MEAPFHNYVANGFIVHNSTRYCNYSNDQFGNEITVIDQRKYMDDTMYGFWRTGVKMCEQIYNRLTALKCPPQIARSVLPNSLKTEIVATADLTEWRHIFKLRTSKKAHPQMRELMVPLLAEFKRLIPVVFDDIVVEE